MFENLELVKTIYVRVIILLQFSLVHIFFVKMATFSFTEMKVYKDMRIISTGGE
jgi:hypothetical protein